MKVLTSNVHSMHLEEKLMLMEPDEMVGALGELNTVIAEGRVSVKWDGAPAIVFGVHPISNHFMIATKSFFNKTPIYFESVEAITNSDLGEGLKHVLTTCFRALLPIFETRRGIYQADVLFCGGPDICKINESTYAIAHSNILAYAARKGTKTFTEWTSSYLGLAVHTEITELGPKPISQYFENGKDVWFAPKLNVITDYTLDDTTFSSIDPLTMQYVSENFDYMKRFINHNVSLGKVSFLNETVVDEYKQFMISLYETQKEKYKTDVSKVRIMQECKQRLDSIGDAQLYKYFQELDYFIHDKTHLLQNMRVEDTDISVYYQEGIEYYKTEHEGFMIESGIFAGCKLIDRGEFSRLNFSTTIKRGWELE